MRVLVTGAGRTCWCVREVDGALRYCYHHLDPKNLPWASLPPLWCDLATEYAGRPWPWDTAVVNWYPWEDERDRRGQLGKHVDKTESKRGQKCPVVTFPLGMPAAWAVWDRDGQVHRIMMRSGQVSVLTVEDGTRDLPHSIERLVPEPEPMFHPALLDSRGRPIAGRWSISVRVA